MNGTFLTCKISQDFLASIGATPADFESKIAALISEKDTELSAAKTSAALVTAENSAIENRLAAIEQSVANLKANPNFDLADVLAKSEAAAKTESARVAMEILAKSGGKPLAQSEPPALSETPKDFLALVSEKAKELGNRNGANNFVIRNHPDLYRAHLRKLGVCAE